MNTGPRHRPPHMGGLEEDIPEAEGKTLNQTLTSQIPLPMDSFFFIWLHWVFIAARGLSLVAASGGYSSLRCAGFSLQWLLLLRSTGSRHTGFSTCGSWALELRLSSCGVQA